ncbi:V-type ATP synthase subunit I [Methanosphaera sp. WGK6]|uniref:V-type ATP synthase subunit I n=1 Tax=Methanosphaera sp. WGK6 TaxID=1561964 RepID=UPI00084CCAB6|nr:V-type ATP synthase subunit I [Methanosphaera sp. WGK6]OED30465.1 ATP synthase subunit I [Methanosphaera sp. WGK6]
MFRSARMQKLSIVTLNQYTKPVIDILHERGVIQIDDLSEDIQNKEEYSGLDVSKQDLVASRIASLSMKCNSILDTLKSAEQSKSMVDVIKGFISPKEIIAKDVEDISSEELADKAEEIISKVDAVLSPIESRMNEIGTEETKYKDSLNVATQLSSFDIDFAYLQDTKYTKVISGRIPAEHLSEAKSKIEEVTERVEIFEGSSNSDSDVVYTPIIIVSATEFEEEISGVLRRLEFEKLDVTGLSGKSDEIIEASKSKLDEYKNERKQCLKDIREVSQRSKEHLLVINEQLEVEKERTEIYSHFGETSTTKMFKAWVVKDDVEETLSLIDEITDGHSIIEVEDPTEEEIDENKVPVKQQNPGFAKPYELLVNMYATPNYKDIDPTIIMAICFPFFFGYCLTDAFYGIILAIVGGILYTGMGKSSKTFKSFGVILVQMGLWTVLLGLLTGGFMGDFIPRFIMGDSSAALPTVIPDINAFAHPENILILALAIGLIHLNIAFIFGIIDNLKRSNYKEMCGGQLCWIIIELSILVYLIAGLIPFLVVLVIGLLVLLYGAGPMGVMDVFGFIGDVLSYSRLLALCLSTGGIGMTANLLCELLSGMIPYVGIIIGILVFLAVHLFNIAFQSMGAAIHSLRLHFVEFFGNFYEGSSELFEPFKAERTYTKIKK